MSRLDFKFYQFSSVTKKKAISKQNKLTHCETLKGKEKIANRFVRIPRATFE